MDNCVFCKLASGELAAHKVFEDDVVFAFLDKHPINPGHILVIPKKHEPDFYKLDPPIYQHLMGTVRKLGRIVALTLNPKKVGLIIAGFDVPHTHVHIVPMHQYHDITSKSLLEGIRANPSAEELARVAERLRGLI